ncbi:DUF5677 domain-containing protein [Trueperella pyogenes]|uniref:DUF5677 domain-containing protein n=1 Tax=Trueperella pyogenes TaxID=1661 RepID=UPI00345D614C
MGKNSFGMSFVPGPICRSEIEALSEHFRDGLLSFTKDEMGVKIALFYVGLLRSSRSLYALATHHSVRIVLTQFLDDFGSMIISADRGEGRDVARAARSTFEHLVNLSDLISFPPLQEQYLDHAEVTKLQYAELPAEYKMGRSLNPSTIEQLKNEVEQMTTKYHDKYRTRWHRESLYGRAKRWGYGAEYEVYRVLSSLVHGNAGGILGNEIEIQNNSVLRVGPNYELSSFGLLSGLRFTRLILQQLQNVQTKNVSPHVLETLISKSDDAISGCEDYQKRVSTLNQELWPDEPPFPKYVAVGAKYPNGKCSWFVYNPEDDEIYPALRPNLPEIEKRLQDNIPTPSQKEYEKNGKRPTTAQFENLHLQVKTPLQKISACAVLMPRDPFYL